MKLLLDAGNTRVKLSWMASGADARADEIAVFGYDHAQIGAEVASRWHFPEQVVDIIRNHHAPETRLSAVVNVVAQRVGGQQSLEIDLPLAQLLEDDAADFCARLENVFERHGNSADSLM